MASLSVCALFAHTDNDTNCFQNGNSLNDENHLILTPKTNNSIESSLDKNRYCSPPLGTIIS